MADTTGTFDFALEAIDVIEEAFERCGRDPQELNHRHIRSAIRSLNLLGIEIENDADVPFRIDHVKLALEEGQRGLMLPAGTIDVLSVFLEQVNNSIASVTPLRRAPIEDIQQLSREQNGRPTQWALSKSFPAEPSLIDSTVTAEEAGAWGPGEIIGDSYRTDRMYLVLWQATDRDTDSILYYRLRSTQDIVTLADRPDYARNWLEGVCAGLAWKLSVKWAPDRIKMLEGQWLSAKANAFRGGRSRDDVMVIGRGFGRAARSRRRA